jgi:hypothetical protein
MKGILLAVIAILNFGCSDFSSQYGMLMIESPAGEKLYFRREARGLNFDSLALTKNPDHCRKPDPSTDIIFKGLDPNVLFYKFQDNELHLYIDIPTNVPDNFLEKTKIVQHEITNPKFLFLKENYKSEGLEMVDVKLNESLTCN